MTQTTRHLTVTTLLKQAAPLRLPAYVDRIDDITKLFDDDLDSDIYRVALSNDSGGSMSLCVDGDELRIFEKFRDALLSRGVRFADRSNYAGERGQGWWEAGLFNLLGGELPNRREYTDEF